MTHDVNARTERTTADEAVPDEVGFTCPQCGGRVGRDRGSIRCRSCQYVPQHGAD